MRKYLVTLWLILSPLWALAQTGSDVDELLAALEGIEYLQGRFEQRQYGEDDVLQVESDGTFRLLRPGYFAWEILSPDSQLIIADPEYIWHHDRDLETVTRRPVTDSAEMSPLQILGGDEATLRGKFQVIRQGKGDFTLTPLAGDAGFRRLTLHLEEKVVTGMEIEDNLNQRVVIEFNALDSTTVLTGADFAFIPPDGADLFYYDQ